MRMSCNGCRVLRKGCSENCSIKPCLQWIKSPESQANTTVFMAKFYGRAGLMNLINAGPDHLRPAIFRSLLYEACGRIVNPIYGSVGLLWSGNWQLCQNAVEAVLKGAPITQIASEAAGTNNGPPLKAYDIRHISKNEKSSGGSADLHRVRTRCRFKRSLVNKSKAVSSEVCVVALWPDDDEGNRSTSHDSSLSHQSAAAATGRNVEGESRDQDTESLASQEETAEAEVMETVEEEEESAVGREESRAEDGEVELELTLGFESFSRAKPGKSRRPGEVCVGDESPHCRMELGLDLSA